MTDRASFETLARDAGDFLTAFVAVFDQDWCHTQACIRSEFMIPEGRTFLHPGLGNDEPNSAEGSDWCRREWLLDTCRNLDETLRRLQRHPDQLKEPD
jgi:hypothetical protein